MCMCLLSHSVRLSCKKMLQRLVFQVFCPHPSHDFYRSSFMSGSIWSYHLCSYTALWYLLLVVQTHWSDHCALLSLSVVSDSLWPQWTVARQAPLSMGILQARILQWVAMPSSRGSSQPRDQTQVSLIASGFFTVWATREVQTTEGFNLLFVSTNNFLQRPKFICQKWSS